MSLKIERIYDNEDYIENTKESYIERQTTDDKWDAPCTPSLDGSVKCGEMRKSINDILFMNDEITNKRKLELQESRRNLMESQYDIDNVVPQINKYKADQQEARDKLELEVAKALESEVKMQKSLNKKVEMQTDISKMARSLVEAGERVGGKELSSDLECNNHGTFDKETNKCICDPNYDPQFLCGQCLPGYDINNNCEKCSDNAQDVQEKYLVCNSDDENDINCLPITDINDRSDRGFSDNSYTGSNWRIREQRRQQALDESRRTFITFLNNDITGGIEDGSFSRKNTITPSKLEHLDNDYCRTNQCNTQNVKTNEGEEPYINPYGTCGKGNTVGNYYHFKSQVDDSLSSYEEYYAGPGGVGDGSKIWQWAYIPSRRQSYNPHNAENGMWNIVYKVHTNEKKEFDLVPLDNLNKSATNLYNPGRPYDIRDKTTIYMELNTKKDSNFTDQLIGFALGKGKKENAFISAFKVYVPETKEDEDELTKIIQDIKVAQQNRSTGNTYEKNRRKHVAQLLNRAGHTNDNFYITNGSQRAKNIKWKLIPNKSKTYFMTHFSLTTKFRDNNDNSLPEHIYKKIHDGQPAYYENILLPNVVKTKYVRIDIIAGKQSLDAFNIHNSGREKEKYGLMTVKNYVGGSIRPVVLSKDSKSCKDDFIGPNCNICNIENANPKTCKCYNNLYNGKWMRSTITHETNNFKTLCLCQTNEVDADGDILRIPSGVEIRPKGQYLKGYRTDQFWRHADILNQNIHGWDEAKESRANYKNESYRARSWWKWKIPKRSSPAMPYAQISINSPQKIYGIYYRSYSYTEWLNEFYIKYKTSDNTTWRNFKDGETTSMKIFSAQRPQFEYGHGRSNGIPYHDPIRKLLFTNVIENCTGIQLFPIGNENNVGTAVVQVIGEKPIFGNWAGENCNTCAYGWYGHNCFKPAKILIPPVENYKLSHICSDTSRSSGFQALRWRPLDCDDDIYHGTFNNSRYSGNRIGKIKGWFTDKNHNQVKSHIMINASKDIPLPSGVFMERGTTARHGANIIDFQKYNNSISGLPEVFVKGTKYDSIDFPEKCIPKNFTILTVSRYGADSRDHDRIFDAKERNWLHGHYNGYSGSAHYGKWITDSTGFGTLTNRDKYKWRILMGNNSTDKNKGYVGGSFDNAKNIAAVRSHTSLGGMGNVTLTINNGIFKADASDFEVAKVIIWDGHLTQNDMEKFLPILKSRRSITTIDFQSPNGTLIGLWDANNFNKETGIWPNLVKGYLDNAQVVKGKPTLVDQNHKKLNLNQNLNGLRWYGQNLPYVIGHAPIWVDIGSKHMVHGIILQGSGSGNVSGNFVRELFIGIGDSDDFIVNREKQMDVALRKHLERRMHCVRYDRSYRVSNANNITYNRPSTWSYAKSQIGAAWDSFYPRPGHEENKRDDCTATGMSEGGRVDQGGREKFHSFINSWPNNKPWSQYPGAVNVKDAHTIDGDNNYKFTISPDYMGTRNTHTDDIYIKLMFKKPIPGKFVFLRILKLHANNSGIRFAPIVGEEVF